MIIQGLKSVSFKLGRQSELDMSLIELYKAELSYSKSSHFKWIRGWETLWMLSVQYSNALSEAQSKHHKEEYQGDTLNWLNPMKTPKEHL